MQAHCGEPGPEQCLLRQPAAHRLPTQDSSRGRNRPLRRPGEAPALKSRAAVRGRMGYQPYRRPTPDTSRYRWICLSRCFKQLLPRFCMPYRCGVTFDCAHAWRVCSCRSMARGTNGRCSPLSKSTQKLDVLSGEHCRLHLSKSGRSTECSGVMQSVPPTRSGAISRGVSTSGSTSTAAEGVNEHDNIKVTHACKVTCLIHACQEETPGRAVCYRHIGCEEHRAPVHAGHQGVGNTPIMCHCDAGGCPAEAAERPGGGGGRHRGRHSRSRGPAQPAGAGQLPLLQLESQGRIMGCTLFLCTG